METNSNTTVETPEIEKTPAAAQYETAKQALVENLPKAKNFKLPENYTSVEDYADALLAAQKGFTQARQELAEYKKKVEEFQKNKLTTEPIPDVTEEDALKILPKKPPQPQPSATATQEDWDRWGTVLTENDYNLPDEVRTEIKAKVIGITDASIDNYIQGLKAQESMKFAQAAKVVGGDTVLREILGWAAEIMDEATAKQTERDLKGPNGRFILLGLKAQYEQAKLAKAAQATSKPPPPPKVNPSTVNQSGEKPQPFSSVNEQSAFIADPRYGQDPNFRRWVDNRILATRNYGFGRTV